jgi:alkylhydroperoxidase family enzyme
MKVRVTYASPMPRVEPAPINPEGNPVSNSLLARVMGRRPDVLKAFARLDTTLRFKGLLSLELKEAVRRATAGGVGCEYCQSLGAPEVHKDARISLAVGFAEVVAADPSGISDATFDVLREEFSEEEIVELVAWICLVSIAGQMFGAVLGLEPASAEEAAEYQQALAEIEAQVKAKAAA